jgi:steroid delta-isomerase-like uncharacterized protein
MTETQWNTRRGYGGPGSFPKEVMGFVREPSSVLAGQEYVLYLSDEQVLHYNFLDAQVLTSRSLEGGQGFNATNVTYKAFEGASGIFVVSHTYTDNPLLSTSVVLDTVRGQAIVIYNEIPTKGDEDFRVRETRIGGYIGKPTTPGEILPPPFPTDIIGRRFTVSYADIYRYEIVFLSDKHLAWHCLKGNPGLAAVEEYKLSQLSENVMCMSWSEQEETLAAVMLINFSDGQISGNMFGYDPQADEILNFALGSEVIDSSEFGVQVRGLEDSHYDAVLRRNKDIILRSHLEVWNRARYELLEQLYTEDFSAHFICGTGANGIDGMGAFIKEHRQSFPDWTERVVDIIAEGDRVVTRYRSTGTHKGSFQGIEATGKKFTVNEVSIYRLENGKIAEQWGFPDGLDLVTQLTSAE